MFLDANFKILHTVDMQMDIWSQAKVTCFVQDIRPLDSFIVAFYAEKIGQKAEKLSGILGSSFITRFNLDVELMELMGSTDTTDSIILEGSRVIQACEISSKSLLLSTSDSKLILFHAG